MTEPSAGRDTLPEVTLGSLRKTLMLAAEVAAQRILTSEFRDHDAARDWASALRDISGALEDLREL